MDFINRDGRINALPLAPRSHPLLVVPFVAAEIPDYGSGLRTKLRSKRKRVRFNCHVTQIASLDLILVHVALLEAGNEDFPQARLTARPHRMAASIPLVEFSGDAHALGIGCPYGKADAKRALVLDHVCAKFFVQP